MLHKGLSCHHTTGRQRKATPGDQNQGGIHHEKIIPLILCLAAIFALTGCAEQEETVFHTLQSYTAEGGAVTEISIDVRDRSVQVSPSQDGQVHIGYYVSDQEYYDIDLSEDGCLAMTAVSDKTWADYIGTKTEEAYRLIRLQVPDEQLEALTIATTNEDITLSSLSVEGSVTLTANGGNILLDGLDAVRVSLNAKNGDISGILAGAYEEYAIACSIKKGDSNLPAEKEGQERTLIVNGNNGDIALDFAGSEK
ncbi:MAG: DUF4097 domain-containing protein [Oscillospiraceae bacterium]|nr:DUF4097 domain-containing protein [Oscillospiraceae bacterium]